MRLGRSVLLQTTAPSADTSPLATPHGSVGRPLSAPDAVRRPSNTAPPTAVARRKSRRVGPPARRLLELICRLPGRSRSFGEADLTGPRLVGSNVSPFRWYSTELRLQSSRPP